MIDILVLGPGCYNCEKLEKLCRETVDEHELPVQIEKVTDLNRIAELGVTMTPGLIVAGKLVSSGRIPRKSDILDWLRSALSDE